MKDITEELEKIINKNNIFKDEPMSKHTSFKIGGRADYFVKVQSVQELKDILKLLQNENIPFFIIGNGTNLLVSDDGIEGVVIKLELNEFSIGKQAEYAYITVGSGMTLAKLAIIAMQNELTGLECMAGIPGTVGGAIRMNAGAYGSEIKDVVVFSKCINKNGEVFELNHQEHDFAYRTSCFAHNELIILETTIKLKYGSQDEIKSKMEECRKSRIANQPIEFPNAGSTFKKCSDIATAKLIDDCDLKGYSIGGAQVSTKHAGFIVNTGNATAKDVLELAEYIKAEVKQKFKKDIELEIIVIGRK